MEKREELVVCFGRVHKVAEVPASLRAVNTEESDEDHKIIRVLTLVYELEQRTILCRENISRSEMESTISQPTHPLQEQTRRTGTGWGPYSTWRYIGVSRRIGNRNQNSIPETEATMEVLNTVDSASSGGRAKGRF